MRYISGESSPEEANELQTRFECDPEFRAQVNAWQHVRQARLPEWNTEQALATLQRELHFGERYSTVRLVVFPERVVPAKRRAAVYAFRIAAALLAGATVATVWRMDWTRRAAPMALYEYTAPPGRRVAVRLADGTQVLLAAETRLRVPRDFGRRSARREVQLEGYAYFDVTHDKTRPFVVRTTTSVTEDLGTAFTIRAYPSEPAVEVVVAKGIVAVQPARAAFNHGTRQVLVPGQLAWLDAKGELRTERDVDLTQYLAWTKGNLAFNGVPFDQAAANVARWFDLDIRLADPALGARRIGGMIAGESADAVLGYLALALDARYELHGRTVTFYPRRPSP